MPFIIEEDSIPNAVRDVMNLILEEYRAMLDPKVREFPLGAHSLSRNEGRKGWDPKPVRKGLIYAVTEGEDDESLLPVLRDDAGNASILPSEGASTAMLNAISWAGSRKGQCTVRFLEVPGGIDAFWATDGNEEVFFPVDYGHLVCGVEFASELKAIADGVESTDWDPWREEEEHA